MARTKGFPSVGQGRDLVWLPPMYQDAAALAVVSLDEDVLGADVDEELSEGVAGAVVSFLLSAGGFSLAVSDERESLIYQPDPLNTMPTG
jgi:hypothetical protein